VVVRAEPQEGVRTERVSYADLNLAEQRDQKRLSVRVTGAVQRVCLVRRQPNGASGPGILSLLR
jgi:UrcA family protein